MEAITRVAEAVWDNGCQWVHWQPFFYLRGKILILLEDKKAVIITPPHTGSGALHRLLCQKPDRYWVIAPSFDEHPDHHGFTTNSYKPQQSWYLDDSYDVYVVHRNPLDRVAGLYNHWCWYLESNGKESKSLYDFANALQDLHWIYRKSIKQICDALPMDDYQLLTYEDLHVDLRYALDIDIDWKAHTNDEQHKEISDVFRPTHYFWQDLLMPGHDHRWIIREVVYLESLNTSELLSND